jgi:hypothetical protein
MFLTVLVFFGLVFTGCPTDAKTDDEPVIITNNPPIDTVDPAFWFGEIYFLLIERVGEISSDNYSGETGNEMGQIANCQYVIDAVNAKWGTSFQAVSGDALMAASCKYLLFAIDRANKYKTSYRKSQYAIDQLVDTNIVKQAVDMLWMPDSIFVAVAYDSNKAAYSADGINWTETTLPSSMNWYSVVYGNGKFVAVARNSNKAACSTDGINWTETTLPSSAGWYGVTYGNGKFVAVARDSNKAAYSTDGITWTAATLPNSAGWYSVTYGGD